MSNPKTPNRKTTFARALVPLAGALGLLTLGVGTGVYAARSGLLEAGPAAPAHAETSVPGGPRPALYVAMEQGFISNLKESDSFVQASIAVSTRGGETVKMAIKENEPALRSVVLQTLAEQDYRTVSSARGRETLRQTLTKALDAELKSKVGIGGIDNVYFTAFVLQ